jgi:hypothetical protein
MTIENKNRYIEYKDALSENYKGTSFAGLDAFERQLKRFGIDVSSRNSDNIENFFEGKSTVK